MLGHKARAVTNPPLAATSALQIGCDEAGAPLIVEVRGWRVEIPVALVEAKLISILCSYCDFVLVEQSFGDCEFRSPPVRLCHILIEGKWRSAGPGIIVGEMGLIVVPVIIEPRFHVELVCELMLIDEIEIGPFIEGMLSIVIEHRSEGCGRHVLLAPLVASREG